MNKFLFLVYLLIAQFVWSNSLIDSRTRPQMEDIIKYAKDIQISSDQLVRGDRFCLDHFRKTLEADAPQFIAKIEKAYPNATFLFLGRDTQLIADVVNAFYLSIGNTGRVKQVGVSSPTLVGLDDDAIMEYLKQYGISITSLRKTKTPIILVDTISKGDVIDGSLISGRQGRNILQIVYKKWIQSGNKPKDLLNKFNMIGMRVSTFRADSPDNAIRYADISTLNMIHDYNSQSLLNPNLDIKKIGNNMQIALVKDTSSVFNEAGYDHYTATWHDKFLPPTFENDKWSQNPGALMPVNYRYSVLWMQKQIANFVFTEKFKEHVFQEGRKIGVIFNETTEHQLPEKSEKVILNKKYNKALKNLLSNLPSLGKKYDYSKVTHEGQTLRLTENGSLLIKEISKIENVKTESYFEITLSALIKAFNNNQIGSRDFRRILTYSMGLKSIDGSNIASLIAKNFSKSEGLEILFGRQSDREALLNVGGLISQNARKIIEIGKIPLSCRYFYSQ